MSLQNKFENAQNIIKTFTKRPTDDELLYTYSLYKQATIGDVNIPQPSIFSMKDRSKWNAWNERKGMKKEVAMEKYCDYIDSIANQYK